MCCASHDEIRRLQKLAYIGEHHFPENTYKARLAEAVCDLRTAEQRLKQLALYIHEIHAHLGAALSQCIEDDDQVIVGHIREALAITKSGAHIARCRYTDCTEGHPVATEQEQITCPVCRKYLGLPALELEDTE